MINCKIYLIASLLFCVTPVVAGAAFAEDRIDREARIDKFVYEAPLFIKSKSLKEIKKIGKLKQELTDKQPNNHDATVTDTFITLRFDGLEIYGYLKSKETLCPIRITITKPQWKILNGLNVDTPSSRIIQILGQPNEEKKNIKKYCGETECVSFSEASGKITKIQFNYYLD